MRLGQTGRPMKAIFKDLGRHSAAHVSHMTLACCCLFGPLQLSAPLPLSSLTAAAAQPPQAAQPPTAEAQASLRKAFTAAQAGFYDKADVLLTDSIGVWQRTRQPPDETAALFKTRGITRQQQGRLDLALADFDEALRLSRLPDASPDVEEVQRTFVLRARVNELLRRWPAAEADLTEAIDRLDSLPNLEATNPYLYSERSHARSLLGRYDAAAEDALFASTELKVIGDKVRRLTPLQTESLPSPSPLTLHRSPSPLTAHPHRSPLTAHRLHLSPLTSHLSPLTSHRSPLTLTLTSHPSPLTQVRCAEAGVYEVACGLWPAAIGMLGELRVDGVPALLLGESANSAPSLPSPRGEAAGLCGISLLSLPAGAAITLAAEHAPGRTKAYLGLRKL